MFFRLMHSKPTRALEAALGVLLIAGCVMRDVMVAFPMVVAGGVLIVSAITDVQLLELLFKAFGGEVPPSSSEHAWDA